MSEVHATPEYRELLRSFTANRVFSHMHPYELYRRWLEAVWVFVNAAYDLETFRKTLDAYTPEQGTEFGRLFNLYVDAVERLPYRDVLGSLFMELDVKSVANGQFFSPWGIAEMLARMQFSKQSFEEIVQEKGVVTVLDPAVGSGVMLLAFASVVDQELGRSAVNRLRLYGNDIDLRCVHMCRIQLRMNGLDSFGRMAGLLDSLSAPELRVLPETTPDDRVIELKPVAEHESRQLVMF